MTTFFAPKAISGDGLVAIGFLNPPPCPKTGWVFKSGSSSFPGFSANVIPLVKEQSGNSHWSDVSPSGTSHSTTKSINGVTYGKVSGKVSGSGQTNRYLYITNSRIFLPCFYGFDLSAVQNAQTSGTIHAWLEAVD